MSIEDKENIMKKIYLASPYSHRFLSVRNIRADAIMKKAAELIQEGYYVFSPITHSHEMAKRYDMPTTFEYWSSANHSMIDWCDTVAVLKLDGWEDSKGVDDEIVYAHVTGKKLIFVNP